MVEPIPKDKALTNLHTSAHETPSSNTGNIAQPKSEVAIQSTEDLPDTACPLGELDLPLRRASTVGSNLSAFLIYLRTQWHDKSEARILELSMRENPDFQGVVDRGVKSFASRNHVDLNTSLIALLRGVTEIRDKAIVANLLISSEEGRSMFVNDYMAPILDGRPYLSDSPDNPDYNFCTKLICQLEGPDLKRLLKEIDYSQIHNISLFGASLVKIPHRNVLLNTLLEISRDIDTTGFDDKESKEKHMQKIALTVMQKFKKDSITIPIQPLKDLYKSSLDDETISNPATELIKNHPDLSVKSTEQFFLECVKDENDKSDLARRRKFWAIRDYATLLKEGAREGLKEFIMTSDDSYLVNCVSYSLAESCGEKGKNALIEAIAESAKKGEESLALAFVCKMLEFGRSPIYVDLIKRLCVIKYPENAGLGEFFLRNADIQIAKIGRNSKDELTFYKDSLERPGSLIDVLQFIGLEKFVQWALKDDVTGNIAVNLKRLLITLKNDDERAVSSMITGVLAAIPPGISRERQYLLGLGSMSKCGTPESIEKVSNTGRHKKL